VRSAHGVLPVPPPAVAELLRGAPSYAGPGADELCTPTGAALLTTLASGYGAQPALRVEEIGIGAGGRDPEGHANVLRLLVGMPVPEPVGIETMLILETNVDDLDPRLWPTAIEAAMSAGALDAWLTPILMKKGRPAHTFRALVRAEDAAAVRAAIYANTTTIGIRSYAVTRHALPRATETVTVGGQVIRVKVARLDGVVVNAQPEYDDLERAAKELDMPILRVLQAAAEAAEAMR
jgi:uncharacterized protein (DUF111 family)